MSKLTVEQAQNIVNILEDNGFNASVYPDYSGRSMYGKTCVGIVTDAPLVAVGYYMGESGLEWFKVPTRTDSMGFDTIVY